MVICKSYQYKLLPTKDQAQMFAQWAGSCRYLFNLGLEHRKINWDSFQVSQTYASQCKELTQLKKEEEVQWLKDVPSQCLQQSLRRLDRAFQNFFEGLAKYPRYKRKNLNDSFCFPDPKQFSISNLGKKGYLKIPKAGRVKFVCSREEAFEGEVSNLTIRRDVDHWLVSIQCEVHIQDVEVIPEEGIGLDLGVIHTLTASNHQHIDLPTIQLKAIEDRIKTLQKKLSQRKKYGSNWRKTKAQLAKLYRRHLQEERWKSREAMWRRKQDSIAQSSDHRLEGYLKSSNINAIGREDFLFQSTRRIPH